MTGIWTKKDFKITCKKYNKENALSFINWFNEQYSILHNKDISPLGFILREIRHNNTHHSTYKPTLMIKMMPTNKKDFEKPTIIEIDSLHSDIKSIDELDIGLKLNRKHYLKKINEIRKERNMSPSHDVSIIPFYLLDRESKMDFIHACDIWIILLETLVKQSKEKLCSLVD